MTEALGQVFTDDHGGVCGEDDGGQSSFQGNVRTTLISVSDSVGWWLYSL
jgi:hypothetical protein